MVDRLEAIILLDGEFPFFAICDIKGWGVLPWQTIFEKVLKVVGEHLEINIQLLVLFKLLEVLAIQHEDVQKRQIFCIRDLKIQVGWSTFVTKQGREIQVSDMLFPTKALEINSQKFYFLRWPRPRVWCRLVSTIRFLEYWLGGSLLVDLTSTVQGRRARLIFHARHSALAKFADYYGSFSLLLVFGSQNYCLYRIDQLA